MWMKVEGRSGSKGGRVRKVFAIQRHPVRPRIVKLLIPGDYPRLNGRVDVYFDGEGKIAFTDADSGTYRVTTLAKGARARAVTIPAQFSDLFPFGTTEISISEEGEMLVVDTSQFSASGALSAQTEDEI